MDEVRDIGAVTIPLAAGVVVAGLLGHSFLVAAVALPLSAAILALCAIRPGRCTPGIILLYFCLGAFSLACATLSRGLAVGMNPLEEPASRCMAAFTAVIDGIPFQHSGTGELLKALLTGRREALDPAVTQTFRSSGASHILALSGLHLGVIYLAVSRILALAGRSRGAFVFRGAVTVGLCGFYTLMTGASPSIVRAFIYICFNELLRLHPERRRSPAALLCAALTLQLLFSPEVIGSLGFQLSYLAMCGISVLFPVLDGWYPGKRGLMKTIWSSAALSISCQVFTAPLVWLHFHTFPRYFLLTNLLALPLTEALMVCALLTVVLSAMGICPGALVNLTDTICVWLVKSLEIISSM